MSSNFIIQQVFELLLRDYDHANKNAQKNIVLYAQH